MAEASYRIWQEYIETIFRRKRILLSVLLAGIVLTALAAWLRPPLYQATSRIQLASQALSGPRVQAMTDKQILAELAMLKSPRLLKAVLEANPGFVSATRVDGETTGALESLRQWARNLPDTARTWLGASPDTEHLDRLVQVLAEKIDIRRVSQSNIVDVGFIDEDPEKAARFVNDLLEHHIARIASLGESIGAQTFFERQAELLASRWREASKALQTFRHEHAASLSGGDELELRRFIQTLEAQRLETSTRVLELTATIEYLSEQLRSIPPTVAGELRESRDESVQLLKSRLLELKVERIELLSRYTEDSSVVTDVDRQIAELEGLLESNEGEVVSERMTEMNPSHQALEVNLVEARADLKSAEARSAALDRQVATYRAKLARLEGVLSELSSLENAVENAKEAHQAYLRETESARLESALDASGSVNLTIVERAEVPTTPLPSKRRWLFVGGTLVSLLLGVACAFVVDRLDLTVKSGLEVARLTKLPVIAEIPSE